MLATYRRSYGPPEWIESREEPEPVPAANEIVVRVHCTTVNRTDEGVLLGRPWIFRLFVGLPKPRYTTLGTDFAGTVTAVGSKVSTFSVGDRVFGFHDHGIPSQAELVAISIDKPIMRIPSGVDFTTAVASLEGVHYALNFINKVKVEAGDKVLVNGGTGAIGSAAFQILQYMGRRRYRCVRWGTRRSIALAWRQSCARLPCARFYPVARAVQVCL